MTDITAHARTPLQHVANRAVKSEPPKGAKDKKKDLCHPADFWSNLPAQSRSPENYDPLPIDTHDDAPDLPSSVYAIVGILGGVTPSKTNTNRIRDDAKTNTTSTTNHVAKGNSDDEQDGDDDNGNLITRKSPNNARQAPPSSLAEDTGLDSTESSDAVAFDEDTSNDDVYEFILTLEKKRQDIEKYQKGKQFVKSFDTQDISDKTWYKNGT